MFAAMKNMIAFAVIFFVSLVESAPYSKYGRTCKDIGCPSNEVCIMAEDPCTYSNSQCGRYPTCKKMSSGEQTCRTFICPSGQYCKTDNGRPVCVNSSPGLAPAARRPPGYNRPTGVVIRPTPPPRTSSNLYPGNFYSRGRDNYNTHVSTDSQGNRTWKFSRNRRQAHAEKTK